MKYDSTLGFAEEGGFRCGTCYEYPVFDIIQRKELELIERPFILMDTSYFKISNLTEEKWIEEISYFKNIIRKYGGEFTFIWHNSSFTDLYLNRNYLSYSALLEI